MRRSTPFLIAGAAVATIAVVAAVAPANAAQSPHDMLVRPGQGAAHAPAATSLLQYGGGPIVTAPSVYIVYWGSQWGNGSITNDPSGEASLQLSFMGGLAGSGDTWSTSTTQYCQGVAVGTTQCGSSGTHVGHPSANPVKGTWVDSGVNAPKRPSQSQIAAEAVRAAQHFGVSGTNVQIIVDAPHGVTPRGFGTQYCAWHDQTTVGGQPLPYTNLPYITDAGAACGANFIATGGTGVNGATEGVTIVGGHEYAETITDPAASNGWLTSGGSENGDLCAWISSGQGAGAIISVGGHNYAVQSLFSNNFNSNSGGCVNRYVSATDQG
jgi:serine protease